MTKDEAIHIRKKISDFFVDKSPSQVRNIVIIDAMNMFMRSFHMIQHIDSDGDHIGGLTGFLKSVGSTIKRLRPTEVYIIFDGEGGSSTKRKLFPEYKGNRAGTKISNPILFSSKQQEREAIYNQAFRCVGYCKLLPVKILSIDNMEADDVVGAIVKKFNEDPLVDKVTLVTEDRDYLQLINDKTKVYQPIKQTFVEIKSVVEKYNAHPVNFAVYKSLVGDPADNIPGVKGLGDKTVQKQLPFLREDKPYSMEYVYQYCLDNQDKHKIFMKILQFQRQLDINYKLVNLHDIQFTEIDEQEIHDTVTSTELTFEPSTFVELYQADNLGHAIPNVRIWLKEVFEPLNRRK